MIETISSCIGLAAAWRCEDAHGGHSVGYEGSRVSS